MLGYSALSSHRQPANISDGLPVCLEPNTLVPTHSKQRSPGCTDRQERGREQGNAKQCYSKGRRGGSLLRCLLSTVDWSVAVISTSNPKVKMASGSSQRFTCRTSKSIKENSTKGSWLANDRNRPAGLVQATETANCDCGTSPVLLRNISTVNMQHLGKCYSNSLLK